MPDKAPTKLDIDYERLGAAFARQLTPVNITISVSTPTLGEDLDKSFRMTDDEIAAAVERACGRNISFI